MAKSQFTIRLSDELLKKLIYISGKNSRSPNKEFEQLIKQDVLEFEKIHGEIKIEKEGK